MLREVLYLIFIILVKFVCGEIQCLDQNNKPVDWFVLFKVPKLNNSGGFIESGEAFMYITSNTLDQGWIWSSVGIQDNSTLLANTLRPYYSNIKDVWILYNDKNPKWGDIGYLNLFGGHTKGVVGADDNGGIWLVHSVPKYPLSSDKKYEYPQTGFTNGQSAFCMSLTPESLDLVGKALAYNDPNFYGVMESTLLDKYPVLAAAVRKTYQVQDPWYIKNEIQTKGGSSFTVFSKAKHFKKDLYKFVASQLQTDLLVETWQHALFPLRSSCKTSYKVLNIKEIGIEDKNIFYNSSKDHSKWAIGSQKTWTCIGDINRSKRQEKRGGGTVCINNKQLWQQYKNLVNRLENC